MRDKFIVCITQLARYFRINRFLNFWLKQFPCHRFLSESEIHYRLCSYASLGLEKEIMHIRGYDQAILRQGLKTFVDLGCNIGLFACRAAHLVRSPNLKALLVDANPRVLEEVEWHLKRNQFKNMVPVLGVVGVSDSRDKIEFFLNDFNVCSSVSQEVVKASPKYSRWEKIEVPVLSVEKLWQQHFPNEARCNLLKIDIEGAELDFLEKEKEFLKRVDALVVEWHKLQVDFIKLSGVLAEQNFKMETIFEENEQVGVGYFVRN